MSRYTTVYTKMWQDDKFNSLAEDDKLLFIYLMTSPHSNLIGLYYIPQSYAAADLEWGTERVSKGFQNLCATAFIEYDSKNKIVLIKNHLKYNPIQNPNQAKSGMGIIRDMPKTQLIQGFIQCVKTFCPNFETYFLTLAEPFRNGMANQNTESETESFTEPENTLSDSDESDDMHDGPSGQDSPQEEIPYSGIVEYLNVVTNQSYRSSTKKTRDCIKSRWNEGFRLEHFKSVIDKKSRQWLNDAEFAQYLRPETLFGNKFESYLNQPEVIAPMNNRNGPGEPKGLAAVMQVAAKMNMTGGNFND